jgi:hypothetical protein
MYLMGIVIRPNKKTPVFPVSRPYLDYRADPITFYSKIKKIKKIKFSKKYFLKSDQN